MKFLIIILFLFISCSPEETPYPEWRGESRSEGTVPQRGDEGETGENITERTEQQGRDEREAAEQRRIKRAEQQGRDEREAAEQRRIERAEQQRKDELAAEQRRIEREEQAGRVEDRASTPEEPIYLVSFLNRGLAPHSVGLTANGETLSLDPDSFPTCVSLKQSELNTLRIDVYTSFFILFGNHLSTASILEECSCSTNSRDTETNSCTTTNASRNYVFTVSGDHSLGVKVNWDCTFAIQTIDIPNASDCNRF